MFEKPQSPGDIVNDSENSNTKPSLFNSNVFQSYLATVFTPVLITLQLWLLSIPIGLSLNSLYFLISMTLSPFPPPKALFPHTSDTYIYIIILFHFGDSPSVAQMYPMQELGIRLYYDLEL